MKIVAPHRDTYRNTINNAVGSLDNSNTERLEAVIPYLERARRGVQLRAVLLDQECARRRLCARQLPGAHWRSRALCG
jgi:hypothetical protein